MHNLYRNLRLTTEGSKDTLLSTLTQLFPAAINSFRNSKNSVPSIVPNLTFLQFEFHTFHTKSTFKT